MTNFKKMTRTYVSALALGVALTGSQAKADQVIPDDLVVQGSVCAGFDCVNNESFSAAQLMLKESNLRIRFQDTSTAGFPNNVWDIVANDNVAGGANYLAFEDITAGRQPFRVTAGAPTASLFVDSTGRIGLKTSAPGSEIHMNDSDTPTVRFEQNSSGGFTAQTWDIGANEANFFIRDLTGGSQLSFRIRPGAPTSSLDIAANGNVGFSTGSPAALGTGGTPTVVQVHNPGASVSLLNLTNTSTAAGAAPGAIQFASTNLTGADKRLALIIGLKGDASTTTPLGSLLFFTANGGTPAERVRIDNAGNVGIGTTAPAVRLHTTGGVRFAGLPGCTGGVQTNINGDLSCIFSSRQFKNVTGDLAPEVAVANIMKLRPQTGSYKDSPDVPEHWLIAEEAANVDPAFVGLNDGRPQVVKTQNVVADLIAVVQQQQRRIDELERTQRK